MLIMTVNMDISIKQQAQKLLDQLPPEGLRDLLWFIEFLQFKYQIASPLESTTPSATDQEVPSDSLTARYRGFVQSPLSVAELTAAYELSMMGDDE
jgi:hypothetical protein